LFFVIISSGKITAVAQYSKYKAPEEEEEEDDSQAATISPLAAESFTLSMGRAYAPQQEQRDEVEEEEEEQKFKAAEEAIPPDKGKLDLDFRTEVIETTNNARSDHGGGRAAHRNFWKSKPTRLHQKKIHGNNPIALALLLTCPP